MPIQSKLYKVDKYCTLYIIVIYFFFARELLNFWQMMQNMRSVQRIFLNFDTQTIDISTIRIYSFYNHIICYLLKAGKRNCYESIRLRVWRFRFKRRDF